MCSSIWVSKGTVMRSFEADAAGLIDANLHKQVNRLAM